MKSNIKISQYGSLLIFQKGYTAETVKTLIKNHNLKGLRISVTFDDENLGSLEFLREYIFLEALAISSKEIYDYNFLSFLTNLKTLSVSVYGKNKIDLGSLVNLEKLTLEWGENTFLGLETCTSINNLCLIDFKEKDFASISHMTQLDKLVVKTASVKNCAGLEKLTQVKDLVLGNCRHLKSIKEINNMTMLESLEIDGCSKIEDYDELDRLDKLETLTITDCNVIPSIKFISKFKSLTKLNLLGNTEVLDGDMRPAQAVKEVAYRHRRHYNVKIENEEYEKLVKENLETIKKKLGR